MGHSDIIAASGSSQHVDLMCHMPRFYQKLTKKIEFFCFHNFLLIFSKISFYTGVDPGFDWGGLRS